MTELDNKKQELEEAIKSDADQSVIDKINLEIDILENPPKRKRRAAFLDECAG